MLPDLKTLGISPFFSSIHLQPGNDLNEFEKGASRADCVLIMCTPILKRKYENNPNCGVAREINQIIRRPKNTVIPLYWAGERTESVPMVIPESTFGQTITPYSYYFILRTFVKMTEHSTNDLEKIWIRAISKKGRELLFRPTSTITNSLDLSNRYVECEGVPLQSQHFVKRSISLQDYFEKSNIVVLTQSEDIFSSVGKTQIAIDFARGSSKYKTIIWSNDSNIEKLSQPDTLLVLDDPPLLNPDSYKNAKGDILIISRNINWERALKIFVPPFNEEEGINLLEHASQCYGEEELARELVRSVENIPSLIEEMGLKIKDACISLANFAILQKEESKAKKRLLVKKGNVPLTNDLQDQWHKVEYFTNWFLQKKGPLHLEGPEETIFTQQYAHLKAANYDLLGCISCKNSSTRLSSYKEIAKKLYLDPDDPIKRVHEFLKDHKGLLIFDDVNDISSVPNGLGDFIIISSQQLEHY